MTNVTAFYDLIMWQKARALVKKLYPVFTTGAFGGDFPLRNQINRSSGSIMDNIAEGFDRDGKREFIQFLTISKGSASETLSQLFRAYDRNYISEQDLCQFKNDIREITRLIGGMIKKLNSSEYRGHKFSSPASFQESEVEDQDQH